MRSYLTLYIKLERFTILEVPSQTVTEVAYIVATAARMGVKVEWIDKTLDEIAVKREHYNLILEARNLEKKTEQLDRDKGEAVRRLGEIELVYKDYSFLTIYNYGIYVISRPSDPL